MLPERNRKLIVCLVAFLRRVCANSAVNKMTPANVGIVFAPSLLKSSNPDPMKV